MLKNTVATLPQTAGRLAFAVEVERSAISALRKHKTKQRLDTNVEYYTALLLEALDVPRSAFTALFAVGRAAGWCAHVLRAGEGRAPDPAAIDVCRAAAGLRLSPGGGGAPPCAGARSRRVEDPEDHVGAGRREGGGEIPSPEAAVGRG